MPVGVPLSEDVGGVVGFGVVLVGGVVGSGCVVVGCGVVVLGMVGPGVGPGPGPGPGAGPGPGPGVGSPVSGSVLDGGSRVVVVGLPSGPMLTVVVGVGETVVEGSGSATATPLMVWPGTWLPGTICEPEVPPVCGEVPPASAVALPPANSATPPNTVATTRPPSARAM
ncbi:hypothetical protein CFN78_07460 [Amycolatopsis antarctica]|uniref:Uncharacterized protein n=1 Tax=Amycolatopsis antarctica TaxID=1854586 RepID=A0A263D6F2_9PSEU|nr:hypothetical protein CFN78_07460 [Amycolatopsis antarctica]